MEAVRAEGPKYVETRMMINGCIVPVGDWFGSLIEESKAINILRARYNQQLIDIRRVSHNERKEDESI